MIFVEMHLKHITIGAEYRNFNPIMNITLSISVCHLFKISIFAKICHKNSLQHPNSKISPHQLGVSEAIFKKCGKQENIPEMQNPEYRLPVEYKRLY